MTEWVLNVIYILPVRQKSMVDVVTKSLEIQRLWWEIVENYGTAMDCSMFLVYVCSLYTFYPKSNEQTKDVNVFINAFQLVYWYEDEWSVISV